MQLEATPGLGVVTWPSIGSATTATSHTASPEKIGGLADRFERNLYPLRGGLNYAFWGVGGNLGFSPSR